MPDVTAPLVAIVDYGMGNLFSVQRACDAIGLSAKITDSPHDVGSADGVILPGVGAFGDAMEALRQRQLIGVLQDIAADGTPFFGICLGMQLLMSVSEEFGIHQGLGIIEGEVVRLPGMSTGPRRFKVPQVGWNRVSKPTLEAWNGSWLEGLTDGAYMYFVHSYYPKPQDARLVRSMTTYGSIEFCSGLQREQLFACQFHPERSGPSGLQIYRNFATAVRQSMRKPHHV